MYYIRITICLPITWIGKCKMYQKCLYYNTVSSECVRFSFYSNIHSVIKPIKSLWMGLSL